jgi:hypothetical protein
MHEGMLLGKVLFKERIMSRNGLVLLVLLAMAMVSVQGCMVAAVGAAAAGTVAYVKGDLQAVEAVPIDRVYEASLAAMEELEYL